MTMLNLDEMRWGERSGDKNLEQWQYRVKGVVHYIDMRINADIRIGGVRFVKD